MIDEHHTRVANAVDALRESLQSVVQTSLSLSDAQGNETMKKLSGWAAIIAVPTLVSGFVGMNVAVPAREHARGLLGRPRRDGRRGGRPLRGVPRQALGLSADAARGPARGGVTSLGP